MNKPYLCVVSFLLIPCFLSECVSGIEFSPPLRTRTTERIISSFHFASTTNCIFASEALALRAIQSPEAARELVADLRRQGIITTHSPLAAHMVAMAPEPPPEGTLERYLSDIAAAYPDNPEILAHIEQIRRTWKAMSHRIKPDAKTDSVLRRIFTTGTVLDGRPMPSFYVIDSLKQLSAYFVSRFKAPIIRVQGSFKPVGAEAEFLKGLNAFRESSGPRLWPVPLSFIEKDPALVNGQLALVRYRDPREGPSTAFGEVTLNGKNLLVRPKVTKTSQALLLPVSSNKTSHFRANSVVAIPFSSVENVILAHAPDRQSVETARQRMESGNDLEASAAAEELAAVARYDADLKPDIEKIFEDFVFQGNGGQHLVLIGQETAPAWTDMASAGTQRLLDDPAAMSRFLLIVSALRKAYRYSENMKTGLASPIICALRAGQVWNLGKLRLVMGSASFRRLIAFEDQPAHEVTYHLVGQRVQDLAACLKAAASGNIVEIAWTDHFGQAHIDRGMPELNIEYPSNPIVRMELQMLREMYGLTEGQISSPADLAFTRLRLVNETNGSEPIYIPTAQITELRYVEHPIAAFQVKFPGEDADRDVIWDTHYYLAKLFQDLFGHDPFGSTMAEPLWVRNYLGQQVMFRKEMEFTPDNPLTIVAFRYHEGIRLLHLIHDQFASHDWALLQYVLSEDPGALDDYHPSLMMDISAAIMTMVLRLHELGYIGHGLEMTDLHLENFMVPFPFYVVPPGVYNIADLGAMNTPEELTATMRRDEMAHLQAQSFIFQNQEPRQRAFDRMVAAKGEAADDTFKARIRQELGLSAPSDQDWQHAQPPNYGQQMRNALRQTNDRTIGAGNSEVSALADAYKQLLIDLLGNSLRPDALERFDAFNNQLERAIRAAGPALDARAAESLRQRAAEVRAAMVQAAVVRQWLDLLVDLEDVLNRHLFLMFAHQWVFVRTEDGVSELLAGMPAAWWRLQVAGRDLLFILWHEGSQTAFSLSKRLLLIDAQDMVHTIYQSLTFWDQWGKAKATETATQELTRRVFYEEVRHLQDSIALEEEIQNGDRPAALRRLIVPGSALERWLDEGKLHNPENDVLEIAAYFGHVILASSERNRRDAYIGLTTPQDPRHAPAQAFVREQLGVPDPAVTRIDWQTHDFPRNLGSERRQAKAEFEKNLKFQPDGGLLPELSPNGNRLMSHPAMENMLMDITRVLVDAINAFVGHRSASPLSTTFARPGKSDQWIKASDSPAAEADAAKHSSQILRAA